ncbi:MAG: PSD1 and planctomycete cytochrome C domain-containing protein [Planctomycetaceae bacterium]
MVPCSLRPGQLPTQCGSWNPIGLGLLVSIVLLTGLARAEDLPETFFEERVAKILERHCVRCHGEETKGGLSLETRALALRGGEAGTVIEPGDAAASQLYEVISGDEPTMPKGAPALAKTDVEIIRRWIAGGAPWPETRSLRNRQFEGESWWSLEALRPVTVPQVDEALSTRVRNPVDAFIFARLTKEGLTPSPEADRPTLIRRLSFDLLGLPPTPAEVRQFVNDSEPRAYERLVDRMLESPHYGERWARHWLDVVHFGETHGYDKDKPRPNAWPYRDYVIRAFNSDLPYGAFLEQQVAGDVLFPGTRDGIEALGFLAAGPWDFIGHAEVPETKIDGKVARHLDRDDMVTNTLQTFNSLTVQCAQCHNHKFDPILQEDYYSLQAVFAAIDRTDKRYDIDPAQARQRQELLARQAGLEQTRKEIEAAVATRGGEALKRLDTQLAELRPKAKSTAQQGVEFGYHSEIAARNDQVKWVQVDLPQPTAVREIVLRSCYDDFGGIGAGFGFPVRYRVEVADDAAFQTNVRVLVDHTGEDQKNPRLVPRVFLLAKNEGTETLQHIRVVATRLATRSNDFIFALAELELRDAAGKNLARGAKVHGLDSIEAPPRWRASNLTDGLYPQDSSEAAVELARLEEARTRMWNSLVTPEEENRLRDTEAQLNEAGAGLAALPPQAVAYVGAVHKGDGAFRGTGHEGGKPRPISILSRGNVTQPLREVGPGAILSLAPLPGRFDLSAEAPEGARRAALAKWLSSRDNPLTWRSIVNRVWQYHFGRGLVDTPGDFGRNGRLPSHPDLLDWLAVEFRDGGQSLKQLHRTLVCSATYRQVSTENPAAAEKDGDNRLLSRMNRRRLEAEAIRDAVLAVSGRLDPTMGGPSFQDFIIDKPDHSPHYEYELADPENPRLHRRSVYRFIVRSQQQPFMTTLDCADPSMQVDRRNESLSALQALALLNNGFMLSHSAFYARRLEQSGEPLELLVRQAVTESLGRPPAADDLAELVAYAREHGLANLCRLLFNLNEFVFVD